MSISPTGKTTGCRQLKFGSPLRTAMKIESMNTFFEKSKLLLAPHLTVPYNRLILCWTLVERMLDAIGTNSKNTVRSEIVLIFEWCTHYLSSKIISPQNLGKQISCNKPFNKLLNACWTNDQQVNLTHQTKLYRPRSMWNVWQGLVRG